MMGKLLLGLNLLALMSLASGQVAIAQALTGQFAAENVTEPDTEAIELSPSFLTAELLAQSALVQITNVRLAETETGLQVILETANGELAAPTTTVSGNALIAEIPNAILALPDEFQQFEPAGGIAQVQVTALPNNQVQVVITGTEAAPTAEISTATSGLTLSVVSATAQADQSTLRLVVTGEEGSRYFKPNAATATRTDTPLRDIPLSIQVIPEEVLEDQQVIRLDDALRNVSGVVVEERGTTSERFIFRGFASSSVLRDGFRLTFGSAGNPNNQELANLERVEVLKGPASILFGSLEPGGVINLVTKKPLSEPFYELSFRAGNQELIEPSLDISGPLTEDGRLRYRLNTLYRTQESVQDYNNDIERFFIAPTVSWQISDRTDFTAHFEYSDTSGPLETGTVALGDGIADIPLDRVLGDPDDLTESERIRAGYDFEHRFSDNWKIRNAFRFNRSDVDTDTLFPFFPLDEATGTLGRALLFGNQVQNHYELQTNVVGEFNTGTIEHTLLAGVDLFRRENPRQDRIGIFAPQFLNIFDPVYGPRPDPTTLPFFVNGESTVEALGIFIQDQVTLSDNLKLLLGVRYETAEQKSSSGPTAFNPIGSESSQNDDAFSPRVGLVYQPIEELSLYGSYSTSFVPNSAMTISGDILDPEEGEQFEIGAKAELLDGRLNATLALFHLTKQNVATPDPNNTMFSIATGEQRSQGIELDITGEILPGWNIIANYAYTDADITDDNSGNEGNRLFGVPENNANLWTTYDIQEGSLEGLGFGLGVNYVGERFGDNANTFTLDDYFLTNAAISYKKDNWRAGLNFRNLFDVDYVANARNGRAGFVTIGEGFSVIGSFSVEF